jgi:hypothetical protein
MERESNESQIKRWTDKDYFQSPGLGVSIIGISKDG